MASRLAAAVLWQEEEERAFVHVVEDLHADQLIRAKSKKLVSKVNVNFLFAQQLHSAPFINTLSPGTVSSPAFGHTVLPPPSRHKASCVAPPPIEPTHRAPCTLATAPALALGGGREPLRVCQREISLGCG